MRDALQNYLRNTAGQFAKGESHNDVHVTMKSDTWMTEGAGEISTTGLLRGQPTTGGTWRAAGFDPRSGTHTPGLDIADGQACHVDHRAEDFLLSRGLLDSFARSGKPAYISLACGEREICFGLPDPLASN